MSAKRILIVEDEQPIREMVMFALASAGYEAQEAADSRQAQAVIAERLQSYSEADKSYSYTIVSGPIPVKNYRSTLRVTGEPGASSCVAEWSSQFDAAEGVEEVMVGAFQHLYETAFVDLKRIMAI